MSSAAASNPRISSADHEDGPPNYDQDVDDFLKDLPVDGVAANSTTAPPAKDVDEEVKVRKKRAPVPKLDDTRLLSDAGVPKLRKSARKIKFKGKGYEFSDVSRLLNMYQLWLDDLYPRAKFRDALTMVEKLGHSKRMQINRRAWMDVTKPNRTEASPERIGDVEMSGALDGLPEHEMSRAQSAEDNVFSEDTDIAPRNAEPGVVRQDEIPEEDDLDALMAADTGTTRGGTGQRQQQQPNTKQKGPFEEDDDGPDEDELDALLAESNSSAPKAFSSQPQRRGPFEEDDDAHDEDELDALMDEESSRGEHDQGQKTVLAQDVRRDPGLNDDFADDEEAMADMGGTW
ncbi:hypothetical protein B0A50_07564 [Salinomyces thailandicus]|uniref:Chromosome segregation in meiosis protein n=1 Tax=Salinomyces thailandicus TaxID=706561 RepID=A0A4U0TNG5_9PEZI|nr:hypothetical protein B0A50_07564 [Salinomyces thailandica]